MKRIDMKRIAITAGAALLVALPAGAGLVGNASFAQSVPLETPSQVAVVDDHGGLASTSSRR